MGATESPAEPERQRIRVMATGVFDILHIGHLHMLEEARKFGDELVVVVARDETARRMKHEPLNEEAVRVQMVGSLKPVDKAVLGHKGDIYQIVKELRPNIITLGFDQKFDKEKVEAECRRRGVPVRVVRLHHHDSELDGTRKIIQRIAERIDRDELYRGEGEPPA